jgi:hypothetical protein
VKYAAKVDETQGVIVDALTKAGASVEFLSYGTRPGRPDLLVGFHGRTFLLEVKSAGRKLRKSQAEWHARWRGAPVVTVWTATDALRAIGALSAIPGSS